MSAQAELWKVMCHDGVFETDLETLQQWIVEGLVQPTDKVCKGNLRWVEAYRAPVLKRVFDGEPPAPARPEAHQVESSVSNAAPETAATDESLSLDDEDLPGWEAFETQAYSGPPATALQACYFHSDVSPDYICRICGNVFCNACVKVIGTSKVTLCPLCGDLCKTYGEMQQCATRDSFRSSGFGFEDLGESIVYPFRHIIPLIFGALVYGFFLLGGFRTQVIAWAVLFGCVSHAINHVAAGRMNRSFLPDFSAFDYWDDVIRPVFLGLGITIVTLGPALLLVAFLFWSVFSGPPPSALPALQTAESKTLTAKDFNELVNSQDEKKSEEIARKIEAMQPGQQIADEVRRLDERTSPLSVMMRLYHIPVWLMAAITISLLWGVFYFPMAITVAGYTENFKSTVNPLIGLDTMRRMGSTYVRAFFMYLVVELIGIGLIILTGMVTAPFDMPLIGNLPGKFLTGIITFYINLVIACLMGLALFKCADRIGIATD